MKPILFVTLILSTLSFFSCQEQVDETYPVSKDKSLKVSGSLQPIPVGCIRGYFDGIYHEFTEQIEKVQPVDSFSNCYFYGDHPEFEVNQINLIRSDTSSYLAIYINGYPLDSLPSELPVAAEFCKYSEIQFSPLPSFNWGPGNYVLDDFYGRSVFITDRTDDILTGTFAGTLHDSEGNTVEVSEGEFKIKIVRKYIPIDENYKE